MKISHHHNNNSFLHNSQADYTNEKQLPYDLCFTLVLGLKDLVILQFL